MSLSKIEIVTGMSKFTGLKAALSKAGVRGMTVMQVLGCGVEKGTKEYEVDETAAQTANKYCGGDREGR